MSKFWGGAVFAAGVGVLGYWGSQSHAPRMEGGIRGAAEIVAAAATHPVMVDVAGRDITATGIADTQAELNTMVAALHAVDGRRVVNTDGVRVLPVSDPYESGLSKDAEGAGAITGNAPSAAAKSALSELGLEGLEALPLAHGAGDDWAEVMVAGAGALEPLNSGSFAITGKILTLQGKAATPAEEQAARTALDGMGGDYERVVSIEVEDPGVVDFALDYDAQSGAIGSGTVPEALGVKGVAEALGLTGLGGEITTTFADLPGLGERLSGLGKVIGDLDRFSLKGDAQGMRLNAEVMPGLDPATIAARLDGFGEGATVVAATRKPAADATRVNAFTGKSERFVSGYWLPVMQFEATRQTCSGEAATAMERERILFLSGSADLDPVSLAVVNRVAGLILHCTSGEGMRAIVGGHTDSQGDDDANHTLSVARAKAVRDALIARGVAADRLEAVGYGETEPVADNETEDGRARNRRTTFDWPE